MEDMVIKQVIPAQPGWKVVCSVGGAEKIEESYTLDEIACWALVSRAGVGTEDRYMSVEPMTVHDNSLEVESSDSIIAILEPGQDAMRCFKTLIEERFDLERTRVR
jgi:hypothetical protein